MTDKQVQMLYWVFWSLLMLRVFKLDVLACPRCASRMQTIAIVQSLEGIQRLLPYSEKAELARGPPSV